MVKKISFCASNRDVDTMAICRKKTGIGSDSGVIRKALCNLAKSPFVLREVAQQDAISAVIGIRLNEMERSKLSSFLERNPTMSAGQAIKRMAFGKYLRIPRAQDNGKLNQVAGLVNLLLESGDLDRDVSDVLSEIKEICLGE